jgi:replication-associated recombination protein RarA
VSLIWPDHVDLVLWLEAQLEQERAKVAALVETADEVAHYVEASSPGDERRLTALLESLSDLAAAAADHDAKVAREAVEAERERLLANFDNLKDMMSLNERAAAAAVIFVDSVAVPDEAHMERARQLDRQYGWSKRFLSQPK